MALKNKVGPIFIVLCLALTNVYASGNGVGNGGDPIELEVTQMAQTALAFIKLSPGFYGVDIAKLEAELARASVKATDEALFSEGKRWRPIINFPDEHLIRVNRQAWRNTGLSRELKIALSLHEYLGLIGTEVNTYQVSSKIFRFTQAELRKLQGYSYRDSRGISWVPQEVEAVLNGIEREYQITCFDTMPDSEVCWFAGNCYRIFKCAPVEPGRGLKVEINLGARGDEFKGISVTPYKIEPRKGS